jgi:hypothetical protein
VYFEGRFHRGTSLNRNEDVWGLPAPPIAWSLQMPPLSSRGYFGSNLSPSMAPTAVSHFWFALQFVSGLMLP